MIFSEFLRLFFLKWGLFAPFKITKKKKKIRPTKKIGENTKSFFQMKRLIFFFSPPLPRPGQKKKKNFPQSQKFFPKSPKK